MPTRIRWYSMSRDLKPVDHEPVDLPEALAVVDRYFGQLRSTYASGEDALASTMFGFARAKDDFLELCLNGVSEISVRVELPRPGHRTRRHGASQGAGAARTHCKFRAAGCRS